MTVPVQVIVGGQFGSESKGSIAGYLAIRDGIDIAVRTGATNAGHTVVYEGYPAVMQMLPVGWVNPGTVLVLGAGSLIDLDILASECDLVTHLTGRDVRQRLLIDRRAYIHRREHKDRSSESGRHHAIGATGKGCSEALMDRIRLRGRDDWSIQRHADDQRLAGIEIADTEKYLNQQWDAGARIQVEGTQGQLLDLYLGPYPYTTHKQTGPALWLSEAGLSPALPLDIVMVIRTYPIRVAGNSGPMPDETSWPLLARTINDKRVHAGLPPIVQHSAIIAFEEAVRAAVADFEVPPGSDGLDQHRWDEDERSRYRIALSELNKVALSNLSENVRAELKELFEMTTVTKKLRRVARFDYGSLRTASRQIRPHRVALTFFNYEFPGSWYAPAPLTAEERDYLAKITAVAGAPVVLINRGPDPSHIQEVDRE